MTPDDLSALIRSRRSSLLIDAEREVPRDLVDQLVELVTWAPNHKRTWPWRLAVLTGETRRTLGESIATVMAAQGDDAPKVEKTRTKYLRAPVIIVVGTAPGDSELQTEENRDAVAAGIQNLLLGATAMGLGSFWSSCPKGANDDVARHCGWESGTHVTAIIYLGWPTRTLPDRERPAPAITYFS